MLLVGSIADKIALYSLEHKVNFVLNICLSHWPNFGLICLFLSVEKMVSNEQFPNPVLCIEMFNFNQRYLGFTRWNLQFISHCTKEIDYIHQLEVNLFVFLVPRNVCLSFLLLLPTFRNLLRVWGPTMKNLDMLTSRHCLHWLICQCQKHNKASYISVVKLWPLHHFPLLTS